MTLLKLSNKNIALDMNPPIIRNNKHFCKEVLAPSALSVDLFFGDERLFQVDGKMITDIEHQKKHVSKLIFQVPLHRISVGFDTARLAYCFGGFTELFLQQHELLRNCFVIKTALARSYTHIILQTRQAFA